MASSLNHPHIVMVYDADELEGQQYLFTEFVDGETLVDWVKQVRPRRKAVELLIGVGDALAEAHAADILHRGNKPGNILLCKSGYAKLADFGEAYPYIAGLIGRHHHRRHDSGTGPGNWI